MTKMDATAARAWLTTERDRLGLSRGDFTVRIDELAADFRWEGRLAGVADLAALKEGGLRTVQCWFKLARYAVERAAVPDGGYVAWLAERNPYFSPDAWRMTRPLLFEVEAKFIAALDGLDEDPRMSKRRVRRRRGGPMRPTGRSSGPGATRAASSRCRPSRRPSPCLSRPRQPQG